MTRRPHWDHAHYRALIAEDDRLEREQRDADRGRDHYDDEAEPRMDAGIFEHMEENE